MKYEFTGVLTYRWEVQSCFLPALLYGKIALPVLARYLHFLQQTSEESCHLQVRDMKWLSSSSWVKCVCCSESWERSLIKFWSISLLYVSSTCCLLPLPFDFNSTRGGRFLLKPFSTGMSPYEKADSWVFATWLTISSSELPPILLIELLKPAWLIATSSCSGCVGMFYFTGRVFDLVLGSALVFDVAFDFDDERFLTCLPATALVSATLFKFELDILFLH